MPTINLIISNKDWIKVEFREKLEIRKSRGFREKKKKTKLQCLKRYLSSINIID